MFKKSSVNYDIDRTCNLILEKYKLPKKSYIDDNDIIYNIYDLFENNYHLSTANKDTKESLVQVTLNKNVSPSEIEDIVKSLLLYSTKIILFIEETYGYHKRLPALSESGGRTIYRPLGSLDIAYIVQLIDKLLPVLINDKIFIVPKKMSYEVLDEDWYYGDPLTTLNHDIDFESLSAKSNSLALLLEKDYLSIFKQIDTGRVKPKIESFQYWTYFFQNLHIPYLKDIAFKEVMFFQEEEPELWMIFNNRIARNIKSIKGEESEQEIKILLEDTYEGIIEIKDRFQRKLRRSKLLASVSLATFGLSSLFLFSSDNEILRILSGITGTGSLSQFIDKLTRYFDTKDEIRTHKYYVPYRILEKLPKDNKS